MEKRKISKLKFKGDDNNPKKPKRKLEEETVGAPVDDAKAQELPAQQMGTGRITSSGTTVQGSFTKFMDELSPGDAIIINHPTSLKEEMKIVRMVLSNTSLGVSSAFSSDLVSTATFRYIRAPKDDSETELEREEKRLKKRDATEVAAFGTYASAGGAKFTYRVKSQSAYGGYKVITENTNSELSREELLNMRSKKKADRFCG